MKYIDNNGVVHNSLSGAVISNLQNYISDLLMPKKSKAPEESNIDMIQESFDKNVSDESTFIDIDYKERKIYMRDKITKVIKKEFPLDERLMNPLEGLTTISTSSTVESEVINDTPVG